MPVEYLYPCMVYNIFVFPAFIITYVCFSVQYLANPEATQ